MDKFEKQQRRDLVYGAKSHIKSILVGLKKFQAGSNVEAGYIEEHLDKLKEYYLDKIINYRKVSV